MALTFKLYRILNSNRKTPKIFRLDDWVCVCAVFSHLIEMCK